MKLLDAEIYKGILRLSTNILKNNFFYDNECLGRFLTIFSDVMQEEYQVFKDTADYNFKYSLKHDTELRKDFTCYFVSSHLHDILLYDLHFSDVELHCFHNLLPEFQGEKKDAEQSNERAHN